MDIENKVEISEDEKAFPILMEEVELAIKDMKNGKATEVGGIPIELIKCLVKGRKKKMEEYQHRRSQKKLHKTKHRTQTRN